MITMTPDKEDLQAIRRLKSGDMGGLEWLIARYQSKAMRTAYLVTHDETLSEDVVQDTFVRFYERARHFDERYAFEPYFLRCVVNVALNVVQKESHTQAWPDDETNTYTLENLLAQAASVEEQVEYVQLKEQIHQALSALSPQQRAVVVQRYYLNMSEAEMSQALEVAPGTVKWLLNAARTRLRNLLNSVRSVE